MGKGKGGGGGGGAGGKANADVSETVMRINCDKTVVLNEC